MKLLLVGAGGYASGYVNELLNNPDTDVIWEGVVDPYYASCAKKELIDRARIPVYETMEAFYSAHTADLAVICTPPFLHREQSIYALSHGSHVLCEKPLAPTVQEAEEMREAELRYNKFIAIGYQWSFSDAIQNLKKDVLSGTLGIPVSLKTAICWPRNRAYYNRSTGWAGRISKDGITVLDSIASNACAHYLHNMFFLLGATMNTSAELGDVDADCLRANAIENFDTCSIRMHTAQGVPLYFIASHAVKERRNPEFIYTFEKAVVTFAEDDTSEIVASFRDGSTKKYGNPFAYNFKKLQDCIRAVKEGTIPVCTVAAASTHTKLVKRLYDEFPIWDFPKELIREDKEHDLVYVDGLFEEIYHAYEAETLLTQNRTFLP